MHVNLKKMARVLGKALILLTIALTLANAQCFARCLVQPCDTGSSPCHSQGNHKPGQCNFRQAVTGSSVKVATPADICVPLTKVVVQGVGIASTPLEINLDVADVLFSRLAPVLLRI